MIDNPRSPRVRAAAKLAKKNARSKTGHFLVEGPQAISELVAHRPELLREVYYTESFPAKQPSLFAKLQSTAAGMHLVSDKVLETIADTVTPQGVAAVAQQPETAVGKTQFENSKLVVIAHQVNDPGNAGTIIRVADAAGADAVVLSGDSVDPFNPKVVRATTGSLFHLPVLLAKETEEVVQHLQSAGMRVLAADVKGRELGAMFGDAELRHPTAWLFGNEAHGLSDELLALTDAAVKVPIYGAAESLNLGTAAAICIYQSAFAQRAFAAEEPS